MQKLYFFIPAYMSLKLNNLFNLVNKINAEFNNLKSIDTVNKNGFKNSEKFIKGTSIFCFTATRLTQLSHLL
ncbi:hypothetical protein GCM10011607_03340 [Shewanella inventionis]|uniref:Uncharacterized protein n=1 Tax=Shewanella inventionis TaxID=1738770 RepID=A0ABQ1IQM3_9GAMM|nr:hypothetical protein GCM10011607_03340 [Shewanella inventionis]